MNRTRRFFGVVFGVLFCFLTGHVVRHVVHGQVPQVHLERLGPQKGRLKENPDGQDFHWASQAARAESSPRGELGFVEALFFARGDGHGADVTGFVIFQSSYSDAALGNVVRLIWTENTTNNPAGVTVAIDGTVLGTAPGLADADLPGLNAVRVTNVPPGDHHFTISGGGTMAEADQLVLASQPFADPSGLQCKSGGRDSANGACDIAMTWSQPQVEPQGILIFVNGTFQVRVFGAVRNFTLTGEPPGSYTVALRGVLDNADGNYLGAAVVQSTCDIACDDLPCDAPGLLFLCQSAYGPAAENAVNADWRNGEISYGGINTLTDGTVVGTFPGDSTSVRFGGLLPGQHTFGVQGDCGAPAGQSAITDGTLTLLTESPHKNPVQGDIVCTFNGGDPPSTTITWTNADPSAFIDVYIHQDPNDVFLVTLAGSSTTVTLNNTTPTDQFNLQFFVFKEGGCYGSPILSCQASGGGPLFHRGDADNNGSLQLTDAVRILNFLFLGTGKLDCMDAADADNNGTVQLTDAVRILNVLFLGTGSIPDPGPPGASFGNQPCGLDPGAATDHIGCEKYDQCGA